MNNIKIKSFSLQGGNFLYIMLTHKAEEKWLRMVFDAALERAQRPVRIKNIARLKKPNVPMQWKCPKCGTKNPSWKMLCSSATCFGQREITTF